MKQVKKLSLGRRSKFLVLMLAFCFIPFYAISDDFTLDVDGNGKAEPLTDGLLIIRYLFGFTGEALTSGAISSNAVRSSPEEIEAHLAANVSLLDIDDDGSTKALTDGLLIIRSLFGFSDEAMVKNAVADTGNRFTAASIEAYLGSIKDSDSDGVVDSLDPAPLNPLIFNDESYNTDFDGDGIPDYKDLDDDWDGVPDIEDAFPFNLRESVDSDNDGIGDNADLDDDNDGVSDYAEMLLTDSDEDGIPDDRDAFPNKRDSESLTPSQRAEINAILDSFSVVSDIDPSTGCGIRHSADWGSNYLRYPDGHIRDYPDDATWFLKWTRYNEFTYEIAKTTVQYWADWLGYSSDLESAKQEAWEKQIRPYISGRLDYHQSLLALDDEGMCQGWNATTDCNGEAAQIRTYIGELVPLFEKQLTLPLRATGFDVIKPSGSPLILVQPTLDRDVGYWTFTADGQNSIEDGADWKFGGAIGPDDLNFDNGKLVVPKTAYDEPFGYQSSLYFDDPLVDRDAFTLAFSFLNGSLPTQLPVDPKLLSGHPYEAQYFNELLINPRQLLLSAGGFYRWLQVDLNPECKMELVLNFSPLDDFKNTHKTFLVSDVQINPTEWNEVYMTFNIPANQASITTKSQAYPDGVLETFDLPEDFDWSFVDDWQSQSQWNSLTDVDAVDNNLNLFSGSGSGSFYGSLDWLYVGNGVLASSDVLNITAAFEAVTVEPKVLPITINVDDNVASMVLSSSDYEAWLEGGFVASGIRNEVLRGVYAKFKDDFDFILLVQNEASSDLSYAGMYVGVSNAVSGITRNSNGKDLYDTSAAAGSAGQLQGVIHFPTQNGICCGPSLHEIAHRWANHAIGFDTLNDPTTSQEEVSMVASSSMPHWGISSVNGQLGGFDSATLEELGENRYKAGAFGTFANGGNRLPYAPLELYLMGLIPASEVPDIISFSGLSATPEDFYGAQTWTAQQKITTSMTSIVEKLGVRSPDFSNSQKSFKALVLYLTETELSDAEMADYARQITDFEATFSWATDERAEISFQNLSNSLLP
jgi:hypothetical protein